MRLITRRTPAVYSLFTPLGAWWRSLSSVSRLLCRRDGVPLPPTNLRAAGPIFRSDRTFRAFAASDIAKIEEHVSLAGKTVLDFGCGAGRLYFGIRPSNEPASYVGVDVRTKVINWARHNISEANQRFQFVHGNVHNDRYNPEGNIGNNSWMSAMPSSFDIVYCYSVLSHLTEADAADVLDLFLQKSAPGALIFLTAFIGAQSEAIVINPDDTGIEISGPLHVVRYRRDHFESVMLRGFDIIDKYPAAATDGQTFYILQPRPSTVRFASA